MVNTLELNYTIIQYTKSEGNSDWYNNSEEYVSSWLNIRYARDRQHAIMLYASILLEMQNNENIEVTLLINGVCPVESGPRPHLAEYLAEHNSIIDEAGAYIYTIDDAKLKALAWA